MGNSIGNLYRLTSFGESHGRAIGGVIDGCPAGIKLDFSCIDNQLNRRRPAQSHIGSQRKESDKVEFLSGIFEGQTTGAPIGFVIYNTLLTFFSCDIITFSFPLMIKYPP